MEDIDPTTVAGSGEDSPAGYQAPLLRRLGTLSELTRGGTIGPDDGIGGAGDQGSLP